MDKKTVEHIESLQGENERLRVLLAEVREFLVPMFHDGCEEGGCDACRARDIDQRIAAAIAEPTHNKGKA